MTIRDDMTRQYASRVNCVFKKPYIVILANGELSLVGITFLIGRNMVLK